MTGAALSFSAARRVVAGLLVMWLAGAGPAQAQFTNQAADRLAVMRIEPTPASLVQYAAQGDASTVELLIAAGVSAKAAEPVRKATALHAAAAQGHLRMVERLLALGAGVDEPDWHGVTPLAAACAGGHLPVARALLRAGARVDHVPGAAPTALILAIQSGNTPLAEELLAAGANPRLADAFGTTPLEAARRARRQALVARLEAIK